MSGLVELADMIVRAWEESDTPFDIDHQIQLAMVAARFVLSEDAAIGARAERTDA